MTGKRLSWGRPSPRHKVIKSPFPSGLKGVPEKTVVTTPTPVREMVGRSYFHGRGMTRNNLVYTTVKPNWSMYHHFHVKTTYPLLPSKPKDTTNRLHLVNNFYINYIRSKESKRVVLPTWLPPTKWRSHLHK